LMRVPRAEFERLVAEALADLPEEFAQKLANVEVVVEDWPGPEHYGQRVLPPGYLLLGLYHGVPITQRTVWATHLMPDRISIFQGPIERVAHTPEQIIAQVRRVVLHEIGHHFGISDKRLRELGC
jgi:predicted Zn-dependent protease with MMP-like domain